MPRMGRVVLADYPHHVVQRGHDRQVVFATDQDFQRYLEDLRELRKKFEVQVHAFCLMTNHVHLLLTPSTQARLGQLMKALAGRMTRYRNKLEGRSGTLWEGRYKSSPVDTGRYLLACCRYIELNPVRAGMVSHAGVYQWSSYAMRMGKTSEDWLDYDPCYQALGDSAAERCRRYAEFVEDAIPRGEWDLIRQALHRGQLTGGDRFAGQVEAILGRRVEQRGPGRPRKRAGCDGK